MYKFELKTIVAGNEGNFGNHTVYLFCKEQDLLLPIKMAAPAAETIILAKDSSNEPRPHIHDTAKRLISALDGKIDRIIFSGYENEIFYTYIRVKNEKGSFDIDAKPSDAISIALRSKAPIYVEAHVVEKAGIKITEELLRRVL